MNGPINPKIYRGAQTMLETLHVEAVNGPYELPHVINDGVMTAFLQLVSEHNVGRPRRFRETGSNVYDLAG